MKECSKCKQQKPKAEFYKRTKAVDGLQSYCKECKKTLRKEYYKEIECTEDSTEIRRERQRTDHYKDVQRLYKSSHGYLQVKASKTKRRKSIINNNDNTITAAALENLKVVQDSKCYYCGVQLLFDSTTHLDHYTPVSKGGIHSITNVVWSCATCNCQKHDKILDSPLSKIHIEELNKLLSETSLN